jgi:hypothetical protein
LLVADDYELHLVRQASRLIQELNHQLLISQAENQNLRELLLITQRNSRDLAVAWRIHMEKPEEDLRDDVDRLIREISDGVAQLEEVVVL